MSKQLHIVLQEAIGNLGIDVLKSPFLVNILQDYGAFDVHDKDAGMIKQRLSEMVKNGQIEKVLSWRNLSEKDLQNKGLALLKQYNDDKYTRNIINSVLKTLGHQTIQIPTFQIPQPKPSVTITQATSVDYGKTSQIQHLNEDDKLSGKNIGCAMFGIIIMLPFSLILFSMDEIGGGLLGILCVLICVLGPHINPDFWK